MEIKRIGENQIRCALTEQEIEELGFDIDEIIGNTEETQKFMSVVLEKVEEQEQIDVELLSPMVRAELLPDHSMTITFGGMTEEEKKNMLDKVLEMMERLADKGGIPDEFADMAKMRNPAKPADTVSAMEETLENHENEWEEEDVFPESTPFALEMNKIDDAVRMSRLFLGKDEIPQSEFYKMDGKYYLLMELGNLSKPKLRPLAFAVVEYNYRHIAMETGLAYIREHGKCIIAKDAIRDLMQL